MNKKRFFIILSVIILCCVLPYLLPTIQYNLSLLFRNSSGQFDLSIFWTGISGIATSVISLIAIWQTNLFKKRDSVLNYKTQLQKISGTHMEDKTSFTNNTDYFRKNGHFANMFVIRKKGSEPKSLTLDFRFETISRIMPTMFVVESIIATTDSLKYDVLDKTKIFQTKPAIITDYKENSFVCYVEIIDECVENLINGEFIIVLEILFYTDVFDCRIETKYLYSCNIKLIGKNEKGAMFKDVFLVEQGSRSVRKKAIPSPLDSITKK